MEINAVDFKKDCLKILDLINVSGEEVIILKDGRPVAKLVHYQPVRQSSSFIGSLTGVGETVGDLTEPFEDEWELD